MLRKLMLSILALPSRRNLARFGVGSRLTHFGNEFRFVFSYPKTDSEKSLSVGPYGFVDGSFILELPDARISVGRRVHIGGQTRIISASEIVIGDDVTIAWGCTIMDHDSHAVDWASRANDTIEEIRDLRRYGHALVHKNWSVVKRARIEIKEKAWIGFGVSILKGVTIGEGAVVGAQSVVTRDVDPYTVVVGNPAKVVKRLAATIGRPPDQ